ncbi:hypothetical protein SAMN04488556_0262 [Halostagnicola kamekurae]|uniref:Uncharacterized protein n=1 Tax=Halostagnicola kamekurae TaxID=619731 RepID=A0A1I6P1C4_9EURY|nr:hypothetical protein SAMN04488556_0262 [Halostagnicola kamekurae]
MSLCSFKRRRLLQAIIVSFSIPLQGCLEWVTGTEEQNDAVLIINNLTEHSIMIEYIVRGEENSILHDDQTTIKAGKGYLSPTFPDETRAVEYTINKEESGNVVIPRNPQGADNSGPTKLTISYTTTDGMRYEK